MRWRSWVDLASGGVPASTLLVGPVRFVVYDAVGALLGTLVRNPVNA